MLGLKLLRLAGIVEGLSWLVLLFIAMPLKYGFGQPLAVRIVGMAHGVLFCVFCALLLYVMNERDWGLRRAAALFGAALVPFGFLFVDRSLKTDLAEEPAA